MSKKRRKRRRAAPSWASAAARVESTTAKLIRAFHAFEAARSDLARAAKRAAGSPSSGGIGGGAVCGADVTRGRVCVLDPGHAGSHAATREGASPTSLEISAAFAKALGAGRTGLEDLHPTRPHTGECPKGKCKHTRDERHNPDLDDVFGGK